MHFKCPDGEWQRRVTEVLFCLLQFLSNFVKDIVSQNVSLEVGKSQITYESLMQVGKFYQCLLGIKLQINVKAMDKIFKNCMHV